MTRLIALECDDSCCEHWPTEGGSLYCSGEVDAAIEKLNARVNELEKALTIIYDEPSNTDVIIDIAYDALNGEV